jgi:hypothetical protein
MHKLPSQVGLSSYNQEEDFATDKLNNSVLASCRFYNKHTVLQA